MSVTEDRFRDNTGERYLANGKIRCQSVSKTKLKQLRIERGDPTLRPEDVWPAAQCSWAAIEGVFACELHGGKSPNANKRSLEEWMPLDLREKLQALEQNKDQILNRDNEIKQLIARNAQLYESLDDLVLTSEAYVAVVEARRKIQAGEIVEAGILLDIALKDHISEREIRSEIRENIKLIDKLTITQFNIRKDLKTMATIDQIRNLLEGMYKAFLRVAAKYIPEASLRSDASREFAEAMRDLANARHVAELGSGD
jgi:hypothetical protein